MQDADSVLTVSWCSDSWTNLQSKTTRRPRPSLCLRSRAACVCFCQVSTSRADMMCLWICSMPAQPGPSLSLVSLLLARAPYACAKWLQVSDHVCFATTTKAHTDVALVSFSNVALFFHQSWYRIRARRDCVTSVQTPYQNANTSRYFRYELGLTGLFQAFCFNKLTHCLYIATNTYVHQSRIGILHVCAHVCSLYPHIPFFGFYIYMYIHTYIYIYTCIYNTKSCACIYMVLLHKAWMRSDAEASWYKHSHTYT
jgi:hypothetical protein